ncbi:hypothetical protein HanIR_Chr01g0043811 [Helianthus annuus]|nr:hypothetical protein HanIR_Chr01g0043811 [Helianthus annuus]
MDGFLLLLYIMYIMILVFVIHNVYYDFFDRSSIFLKLIKKHLLIHVAFEYQRKKRDE